MSVTSLVSSPPQDPPPDLSLSFQFEVNTLDSDRRMAEISPAGPRESQGDVQELGEEDRRRGAQQLQVPQQALLEELREAVHALQAEVVRWRSRAAELQGVVASTREELEQICSERNVVRAEAQSFQRRWQQQVQDYERRLNAALVDCERLQREVQRLLAERESSNPADAPAAPVEAAEENPPTLAADAAVDRQRDRSVGTCTSATDLRHVFTRLRERSPGRAPCR